MVNVIATTAVRDQKPCKDLESSAATNHQADVRIPLVMSSLLTELILRSLPSVSAEATRRLAICNEELSKLPPPLPTEPPIYMLKYVASYSAMTSQLLT